MSISSGQASSERMKRNVTGKKQASNKHAMSIMQEDIAKLNKRISTLNKQISTLEEENVDRHSWLRFQEGEMKKNKEKITKMESMVRRWEQNEMNAVIRQLALDLERQVRVFLISKMDSSQQEEYFYRDDDSLNIVRVDAMEYRNLVQNDPQMRQKLMQEFFPGYESERRYRTFCVTMRDMKALFNPVAHPVGDLDGNPITNTSIFQYLEASTLSQEVKLAAKEFVTWLYPD